MIKFSESLNAELEMQLQNIHSENADSIEYSEQALKVLIPLLEKLKTFFTKYKFSSKVEEIIFFREIKPKFAARLIYYNEVFKDITLKASEIKFMPFEYQDEEKIDMIVYHKDFTVHCKNKSLFQVVFVIIQDLLGEKSLFQNINFVELAQMPEEEVNELIQLYDLQFYLDDLINNLR